MPLVYVFNFNFFEFSAAILEKGLFTRQKMVGKACFNMEKVSPGRTEKTKHQLEYSREDGNRVR